jgi:hypothetical protein
MVKGNLFSAEKQREIERKIISQTSKILWDMIFHMDINSSDQTCMPDIIQIPSPLRLGKTKKSTSSRHQMTLPLVSPYCPISSSPAFFPPASVHVGGKKAHWPDSHVTKTEKVLQLNTAIIMEEPFEWFNKQVLSSIWGQCHKLDLIKLLFKELFRDIAISWI